MSVRNSQYSNKKRATSKSLAMCIRALSHERQHRRQTSNRMVCCTSHVAISQQPLPRESSILPSTKQSRRCSPPPDQHAPCDSQMSSNRRKMLSCQAMQHNNKNEDISICSWRVLLQMPKLFFVSTTHAASLSPGTAPPGCTRCPLSHQLRTWMHLVVHMPTFVSRARRAQGPI